MAEKLTFQIADLEHEINNLMMLYPSLLEDEDLLRDTLEGSTDFVEIMGKLVDQAREHKTMAAAVSDMIDALAAREQLWKTREAATRGLMLRLMNRANQRKVTLPQATISIANGRKSVCITDETALPEDAFVTKREVSKTKLKALMETGDVPGAVWSNGSETLTIR